MKNVIKLLSIHTIIIGCFLFFSIATHAQKNAFGTYINVEFNMDQNKIAPPDLLPGFFLQFPFKKKFTLMSNFSFGRKRYSSTERFNSGNSKGLLTTQFFETTFSFEQMLKCYIFENSVADHSVLYFGLGYSLRTPFNQKGDVRSTLVESYHIFRKQDLSNQTKLNIAFGIDYYIDENFFLSFETGLQTPVFDNEISFRPILVRNNILFFNIKIGIQLHQIMFNGSKQPEYINIKDLEIKN